MSWKGEWAYHQPVQAAVEEASNMIVELAARIASTKSTNSQLQPVER